MSKTEKITAVKPFLGKGLSASDIAAKFFACTRNAIIGCVHRDPTLKLATPAFSRARRSYLHQKAFRKHKPRSHHKPVSTAKLPKGADAFQIKFAPPDARLFTLMALQPHQCKWPLWQGLEIRLFCGANMDDGHDAYCAFHRALAKSAWMPKDRLRK